MQHKGGSRGLYSAIASRLSFVGHDAGDDATPPQPPQQLSVRQLCGDVRERRLVVAPMTSVLNGSRNGVLRAPGLPACSTMVLYFARVIISTRGDRSKISPWGDRRARTHVRRTRRVVDQA